MATQIEQRLLTAREFLQIDFGPDIRAELDNGVIRLMAGGTIEHSRIQMNLYRFLGVALRGSGCRPFGSDAAIATRGASVRYPDVSVSCAPPSPDDATSHVLSDPRVAIEVLSPSTRMHDTGVKLEEYLEVPSLRLIALIDPANHRIRLLQRGDDGEWFERLLNREEPLPIPVGDVAVPQDEIFATD